VACSENATSLHGRRGLENKRQIFISNVEFLKNKIAGLSPKVNYIDLFDDMKNVFQIDGKVRVLEHGHDTTGSSAE
jgi:hypothetical protein